MKNKQKEIEKDYYTTKELTKQPWFPIRSTITLKKFIQLGKLSAVNISTRPDFRRYRIPKQAVKEFLESRNMPIPKSLKDK